MPQLQGGDPNGNRTRVFAVEAKRSIGSASRPDVRPAFPSSRINGLAGQGDAHDPPGRHEKAPAAAGTAARAETALSRVADKQADDITTAPIGKTDGELRETLARARNVASERLAALSMGDHEALLTSELVRIADHWVHMPADRDQLGAVLGHCGRLIQCIALADQVEAS